MKNNSQITENFTRKEFACKCGCGLNRIHVGIVNRLQVFRDILIEPIFIRSGCRCPTHNRNEEGTEDSFHLEKNDCKAVDWTIGDKDKLRRFATHMEDKWSGGWHYYPEEKFVHSDIGPRRRW